MNIFNISSLLFNTAKQAKSKIDKLPQIAINPDNYLIIQNPKFFKERVISLIRSAKKRICLTALYLQNDELGQEILDELYKVQKNNPHIHIRIYVDFHRAQRGLHGKGEQIGNNQWYRQMSKTQIHHPTIYGVPVKRREIFGVLHLKGFVFDDTVLYSGASINNVYFHNKDNYRIDRYHEIYCPELADTFCNYCTDFFHQNCAVVDLGDENTPKAKEIGYEIKQLRKILSNSYYKFDNENISNKMVGVTPLVGLGKTHNQLNSTIIDLILAAKNEIFLCTPYFNFPSQVVKAINKALKNNIKIMIIVGDKTANDFFIKDNEEFNKVGAIPYIYEMNLRDFIETNNTYIQKGLLDIRLWKSEGNTYHVKGMTVDNQYSLITGNNLNPRAWNLDLENGLLIHDKNHLLLEKFMHEKQFLLQNTTKINSLEQIETFDQYPIEVKKLISNVKKFGAQWLLRRLL